LSSAIQTEERTKKQLLLGQPLKRMDDPKFITGTASFMDDIRLPGMLHAVFVRSLHAHARIVRVDASRALKNPAVRIVLTGDLLAGSVENMPSIFWDKRAKGTPRPVLAIGEVNFAGEPVALVVATDRASAEDATELVEVEYDPLPVIVDPSKALEPGSPKVHSYLKDNVAFHMQKTTGDVERVFKKADLVVTIDQEMPRLSAVPLEPRNIIASYEPASDFLTAWVSCQSPHDVRDELAEVLRLRDNQVRVIAPDMGGGFGQKNLYPEHAAVCYASMKLGRPVKWVESRAENLTAAYHGRGQTQHAEAAVRKDGRVLGMKVKIVCDGGAYSSWNTTMPMITVALATGAYDIGAYSGEVFTVFTNKTPTGPYRGASRPEAVFVAERIMNQVARKLKLDPAEVRRRNYIPKSEFPYDTPGGLTYDSGDYETNLDRALVESHYSDLKVFQREARAAGRLVGIGVATYVEISGFGPDSPQTAAVTVTQKGSVIVNSGTTPHGQGHWTPFAQIVADELGIDAGTISFRAGDTAALPFSTLTAGSRSAVLGGSAVLGAATKIKRKMGRIAAMMLEVGADEELVFEDSQIRSATHPEKSIGFADVAEAAYNPERLPPGMESTLYEYCAWAPSDATTPFGTHVAMVEVDGETGQVKILKYVAVDDAGRILNSLIADGQVVGGTLQGIAEALQEEIVYDENGQLLTATLSDYLIPNSDVAPRVETYRTVTPSPLNPLGVKGIGESGTTGAPPAIVNAVEDALSPYDVTIGRIPMTPSYLWSLVHK